MIELPDDNTLYKLPSTFVCPHCYKATLWLEIDEWETETGVPTEAGVHVSCENEEGGDHWDMPYVTLLPLEHRVYRWCERNVRIVESEAKTRARLAAWNAGLPIVGKAI